ncbi:hypothetical protein RCL_jg17784.t1 [Rhizophagus clarus]|uniref:Uncharacterized protein n=1 Tax=Rhizophagus clarus TaxID=94130 RepID=A0A8H3L8G2_9GLOM|nr:hypothetical protein RCL_jg17784.t1 [Rhizophagus clarus]
MQLTPTPSFSYNKSNKSYKITNYTEGLISTLKECLLWYVVMIKLAQRTNFEDDIQPKLKLLTYMQF